MQSCVNVFGLRLELVLPAIMDIISDAGSLMFGLPHRDHALASEKPAQQETHAPQQNDPARSVRRAPRDYA